MGLGPRVVEKIGRRELCAADFRFDPENRVQIGTGSILGQIDPVPVGVKVSESPIVCSISLDSIRNASYLFVASAFDARLFAFCR